MNVTICQNKEAPIRVSLKLGDIEMSIVKAQELRDRLTNILEKYKREEDKRRIL